MIMTFNKKSTASSYKKLIIYYDKNTPIIPCVILAILKSFCLCFVSLNLASSRFIM